MRLEASPLRLEHLESMLVQTQMAGVARAHHALAVTSDAPRRTKFNASSRQLLSELFRHRRFTVEVTLG